MIALEVYSAVSAAPSRGRKERILQEKRHIAEAEKSSSGR